MRIVTKHNIVKQRSFAERLEELMRRYTNQNLTAAQIIAELVALAKEVAADASRGGTFAPPLNPDELAFYDAVAQNESAVTEMGSTVLADIARDLVRTCAATSPPTGWPAMMSGPRSVPPSSACWPSTATP
jgi:type I restriction enzyme, R subunit